MMTDLIPAIPDVAPRRFGKFTRWLGRTVLKLGGWRVVGDFPNLPHLVIIAAPHSSAWDGLWGLAAKLACGLHIEFMAKKELFWWPLGVLLRALDCFPINRSTTRGTVENLALHMRQQPKMWLAIAPEGTRKKVDTWKNGFWRIARAANVPILCCYFHYPEKIIGMGLMITPSENLESDMQEIREFYRPWQGKNRSTVD